MSRDLFGHPRGLTYLFGTDMWERFSYYGMRALLIYYLTKYVLLPGHVEQVLFYPAIKNFYEWMSGPLNVQQLSSLIYGTYTGLVYGTPLIGGWIAWRALRREMARVGREIDRARGRPTGTLTQDPKTGKYKPTAWDRSDKV